MNKKGTIKKKVYSKCLLRLVVFACFVLTTLFATFLLCKSLESILDKTVNWIFYWLTYLFNLYCIEMTELTMIILVMNETAHSMTRASWSVYLIWQIILKMRFILNQTMHAPSNWFLYFLNITGRKCNMSV